MSKFIVKPSQSLSGNIQVPGDKSISHRSIMFGSLAKGITKVSGFLEGEDSLATLNAFMDMGVNITRSGCDVVIKGVGMQGLKTPKDGQPLYLGNSGTSMRLMSGILAAQSFDTILTGDMSLSGRPMNRIIKPLTQMGAKFDSTQGGKPPLHISGGQNLSGIDYQMPIASAQVKSALLLAAMYAKGQTTITEITPSRDHTERMLSGFSYPVSVVGNQISMTGGHELIAADITVPSDISSAAFFMVGACIAPKADIVLKSVNINPTRTGVIDILKLMGANITLSNQQAIGGELLADISVQSSELIGIDIPKNLVPLAIDEFPAIFMAASCAKGTTRLTNAKELRVKESDRIQTMADGLLKLGVNCTVLEDGIEIVGNPNGFNAPSQEIDAQHDHRIAMSFVMASLRCQGEIVIDDCDNVKTSFPNFVIMCHEVGLNIQVI